MSAITEKSSSEVETTNEQESPALTDGFHLVIDALKLNGIDTIYGVPGIPITDLTRLAQAEGIRFIGFRHEASAGNAAAIAGYLTKKPGICLTVSAPGFLNGLVALANATTNGFPMIQISGSSERHIISTRMPRPTRWCGLSIQHHGKFLPRNRSNGRSSFLRVHSGRSSFLERALLMHRPTLISVRLSKKLAFPTCLCRWPRDSCLTTILNLRPRPAL
jgi:hypothetical protein